jgi:hypothetical protein
MDRIEMARGRWVRFSRPMYISDRRAMAAVSDMPDGAAYLDVFDHILAVVEPAVAERSWDGPFDQMTDDELWEVCRAWRDQTEGDALPPAEGTSSETTPQPGS